MLYLDTQDSEFSSVCRVWNFYCVTNFKGWFTFCELCRISKDCWKTKTGSNLSSWNWNFELKNECFLFRILVKCLLETFSTPNLVSNGVQFSIFGHAKLKTRFFSNLSLKAENFRFLMKWVFEDSSPYLDIDKPF